MISSTPSTKIPFSSIKHQVLNASPKPRLAWTNNSGQNKPATWLILVRKASRQAGVWGCLGKQQPAPRTLLLHCPAGSWLMNCLPTAEPPLGATHSNQQSLGRVNKTLEARRHRQKRNEIPKSCRTILLNHRSGWEFFLHGKTSLTRLSATNGYRSKAELSNISPRRWTLGLHARRYQQ